jgi:hypothetical protein
MADASVEAKAQKERSPAYPFIPLKTAVERLVQLEAMFTRHPVPAQKAGLAWDMKGGSSQAGQTLAALKYFGFIEYQGGGADRVAIMTEDARTYLRAQQESVKKEVLRRAALKPTAIAMKWEAWGADRPPDAVCLDQLVLKDKFTSAAAETFLRVYDETVAYAGLAQSGTIPPINPEVEKMQQDVQHGQFEQPPPPPSTGANAMKVTIDGDRIQVSANVDLRGARRLLRALQANMSLLEDADEDDADEIDADEIAGR